MLYDSIKRILLPVGNTTVLDCIEVKYNPKIIPKNPIKSTKK